MLCQNQVTDALLIESLLGFEIPRLWPVLLVSACRSQSPPHGSCCSPCSQLTRQPCWVLSVSSRPCCLTSPTHNDFNLCFVLGFFFVVCLFLFSFVLFFCLFVFYNSLKWGGCTFKQRRLGATVGRGNGWVSCIVIYMQKWTLPVCTTAHHSFMMACIYTNTQTCTYTVHTCTHTVHMHIYAYMHVPP